MPERLLSNEKLLELHRIVQDNLPSQEKLLDSWRQERLLSGEPRKRTTSNIIPPWAQSIIGVGMSLGQAIGLNENEKQVFSLRFFYPVVKRFGLSDSVKEAIATKESILSLPLPSPDREKILSWHHITEEGGRMMGRLFLEPSLNVPLACRTLAAYETFIKKARPLIQAEFNVKAKLDFSVRRQFDGIEAADYHLTPKKISEAVIRHTHAKLEKTRNSLTPRRFYNEAKIFQLTGKSFKRFFNWPKFAEVTVESGIKLGKSAGLNNFELVVFITYFSQRVFDNFMAELADEIDYFPKTKREITEKLISMAQQFKKKPEEVIQKVTEVVLRDDPGVTEAQFEEWLTVIKNYASIMGSYFSQSELDPKLIQLQMYNAAKEIATLRIDSPLLHLVEDIQS